MKKKFLIFAACFSLMLTFGAMAVKPKTSYCYAETEQTTVITEEITENNTFFGRVYQWVGDNYKVILQLIGDAIIGYIVLRLSNKTKKSLTNINTQTTNTNNTQSDVVKVVNELIVGYNEFDEKLKSYTGTQDENYKMVAAMVVQTKAILEILTTVYANSKNLPQGVKDLVNLKYADVLKTINEDKKLKEIADSVKSVVDEVKEKTESAFEEQNTDTTEE